MQTLALSHGWGGVGWDGMAGGAARRRGGVEENEKENHINKHQEGTKHAHVHAHGAWHRCAQRTHGVGDIFSTSFFKEKCRPKSSLRSSLRLSARVLWGRLHSR